MGSFGGIPVPSGTQNDAQKGGTFGGIPVDDSPAKPRSSATLKPRASGKTVPAMYQSGMGGGEPGEDTGNKVMGALALPPALIGGSEMAMGAKAAYESGGIRVAGRYAVRAAADITSAYIAQRETTNVLEHLGVNSVLANIGGLMAAGGIGGMVDKFIGKETFETLAADNYKLVYGREPKTSTEKLQARGMARKVVNDAAKTPKVSGQTAPVAEPATTTPTTPVAGATSTKSEKPYSFTHPDESITDVRKQLFANAAQQKIPNALVRERFKQLHGHGISEASYEEVQQYNEHLAKNGKLPAKASPSVKESQ